ncbi:SRPBCC family protein [Promicromonospora soli]|uniref:Polyketide cyclase n=1 Tax=Promicromonospora soli TaxID=2035533 RepID=A0A919G982_9MICO|nr:SRPBCC family protein [Promicromonospora soli]GHH80375.1 polyketide cyclase [Promicromonospora soli]
MNAQAPTPSAPGLKGLAVDTLKSSVGGLAKAVGGMAVNKVTDKVGGVTQRLTDYAEGTSSPDVKAAATGAEELAEGGSPITAGLKAAGTKVMETVKGLFGGGGGKGKAFKFNNIVEAIDVGAPIDIVYDAWTQYDRWPDFMKKVEHAELNRDEGKVEFKGQVFWSSRQWQTTITHQDPGKRIVWRSTGAKGHLSGTVTFHSLDDELTRIVLVVEYHPKGFMEKTGNVWKALNRRLRLELKLFVRYVMTDAVLNPDNVEGYWAEIDDEEIVRSHDQVLEEEFEEPEGEGEYEDEASEEEEPEEEEPEEEAGDEEPEDEYEEEEEEEEYEEEPEEAPSRTR